MRPGEKYREIGNVIQRHASERGYSVVRSYCGHGIHRLFHCSPNVPHYARNKAAGVMRPGHCFTIEPMISQGENSGSDANRTPAACLGRLLSALCATVVLQMCVTALLNTRPDRKS